MAYGETPMPATSPSQRELADARAVERLFRKADPPAEWHLTQERFGKALERSAARRFHGAAPSEREVAAYLDSLHLVDLALACACSEGNTHAWEQFMTQFRPELYRAARAIAGESRGRELADSLYAELYGLETREGQRRSLFDYFYGRSKLTTWLRAVLAQRHVDELRRGQRTESLDEGATLEVRHDTAATPAATDPDRTRYLALLQAALSEALAALEARDRLRLAYYYVDELTLAQIGRLIGEHEATVSRKLDRARLEVRKHVESALREKKRLSEAQVRLCYEYAQEEWPFDLTGALSARE